MGGEVSGHDDIARAVRERADRRVDVIKVMASGGMTTAGTDVLGTQFSDDDLTFLVHEAHRHGLPVTAHAHSLPAVEQALAAGVDGLEHASCLTERGFAVPDAVLDLLAERQIPVGAALGSPPVAAFAHAPAAVRAQFERTGLTPEAFREARLATIRRMHEAGVLLLAGRDSGISSFLTHGSIWDSIAFYIDAGAPTRWRSRPPPPPRPTPAGSVIAEGGSGPAPRPICCSSAAMSGPTSPASPTSGSSSEPAPRSPATADLGTAVPSRAPRRGRSSPSAMLAGLVGGVGEDRGRDRG